MELYSSEVVGDHIRRALSYCLADSDSTVGKWMLNFMYRLPRFPVF